MLRSGCRNVLYGVANPPACRVADRPTVLPMLYQGVFPRFVPEGPLKIAQHFRAGLAVRERSTSPEGRTETLRPVRTIANVLPSLRDSDTFDRRAPSTKVLGYDRKPLRGKTVPGATCAAAPFVLFVLPFREAFRLLPTLAAFSVWQ